MADNPAPISTTALSARTLSAIVLAAGEGKRMRSERPKVLHEVCGRPMIDHVLTALETAGVSKIYVVVGHKGDAVREHLKNWGDKVETVEQAERLGTGHAVLQAAPMLAGVDGDVIVTCGDTPLLTAASFRQLIHNRQQHASAGNVLTAVVPEPFGYGRIVRRDKESVQKIVEDKDATEIQRRINEVNTGTYCFDGAKLFDALREVRNQNQQGEYYLTDVVEILFRGGNEMGAVALQDWTEMLGVNSREQLAEAAGHLRRFILTRLMEQGVTITDPRTTQIDAGVAVGAETVIEPFTCLRGTTAIGGNCKIGPCSELIDATIADGVTVRHSVVEGAYIGAGEIVGPFAHVRGDH